MGRLGPNEPLIRLIIVEFPHEIISSDECRAFNLGVGLYGFFSLKFSSLSKMKIFNSNFLLIFN